jgi:hypothetical protein
VPFVLNLLKILAKYPRSDRCFVRGSPSHGSIRVFFAEDSTRRIASPRSVHSWPGACIAERMMSQDSTMRRESTRQPAPHDAEVANEATAVLTRLVREIDDRQVILFVGSGISAALGLPTWDEFIGRLGAEFAFEPNEFLTLSSDFRSLAEFYRLEKGSLTELCSKMAREWKVSDEKLAASRAHELIVRLDFPIVYTTNYDHLLERAYQLNGKPFNKIVSARDIARSDPTQPTIVKFHGDLDDPGSVVLAETDYFHRLSFEHPLDIKLAGDALGKAVLFVGYSVSDINLRLLLYRLQAIWRASGCEDSRPRSYVFMTKSNQVQERILDSWGVAPLIAASSDETSAVAVFLERLCTLSGRPHGLERDHGAYAQ